METMSTFYKGSLHPEASIQMVAYPGQPESHRHYHRGFEYWLESLPLLNTLDPLFQEKLSYSYRVLQNLGECLRTHGEWFPNVAANGFERSIIGIEAPTVDDVRGLRAGIELIVAHWGKGFTSPIHGHTAGLHYEDLIEGKFLTHEYRQVDPHSQTVRLIRSELIDKPGAFVTKYETLPSGNSFNRPLMIHNFTALEPSDSLHFLGEHSLDGMGNEFYPEYFEDVAGLTLADLTPLTPQTAIYLPIGSVVLVRSANVPDYGDHYIVITGRPTLKPHGLRPEDEVIHAPHAAKILDVYSFPAAHHKTVSASADIWEAAALPDYAGRDVILLQLSPSKEREFLQFHGIAKDGDTVTFPKS